MLNVCASSGRLRPPDEHHDYPRGDHSSPLFRRRRRLPADKHESIFQSLPRCAKPPTHNLSGFALGEKPMTEPYFREDGQRSTIGDAAVMASPTPCVVCRQNLPIRSVEEQRRGGRPKRTCSPRCKGRADRRSRTLKAMRRRYEFLTVHGVTIAAATRATRIDLLQRAPFTGVRP
jgi:hypothetical protein